MEKPVPEETEESFLVCLPVAGAPRHAIVPTSRKERCRDCNCQVFVSPTSWELKQTRKLVIICIPCARKRAADDDELEIESPTPEQREELTRTLGHDVSEERWNEL